MAIGFLPRNLNAPLCLYRPYGASMADERLSLSDSIPLDTYADGIQKNAYDEPLDLMLFTYSLYLCITDKRM